LQLQEIIVIINFKYFNKKREVSIVSFYDVAAWVVPLENGLKKKHLERVLDLLPDDSDLVPFEIHEVNSSAYGFATMEAVDQENGLEKILDTLGEVVEDWTDHSSNISLELPGGRKAYIGCDYRTVVFDSGEPDD